MQKAELILSFTKTLIWPFVALTILIMFNDQIGALLEGEIETEIFGVSIKGRPVGVNQLHAKTDSLESTIIVLEENISRLTKVNAGLLAQLDSLQGMAASGEVAGADHDDMSQMQRSYNDYKQESRKITRSLDEKLNQVHRITKNDRYTRAKEHELNGFKALLDGKYKAALAAFREANDVYPSFHSVSEIADLLSAEMENLQSARTQRAARRKVLRKILKDYSWKMPENIKDELKAALG